MATNLLYSIEEEQMILTEKAILNYMSKHDLTKKEIASNGRRSIYRGAFKEDYHYIDNLIISTAIVFEKAKVALKCKSNYL